MSDLLSQIDDIIESEPDSAPSQDSLEAVTDLLSGKKPEEATAVEPVGDDDTSEEEAQEEAPAEVPDGLDYSAEVPMQDGSKVTLGALKDAYQDTQRNDLERQERENALFRKEMDVNDLLPFVQLPPEKAAQVKQDQEAYMRQQHELMLEMVPEMADQTQFVARKQSIEAHAKEWGIERHVERLTDAVLVRYINAMAKREDNMRSAAQNVKPLRSKEPKAVNKSVGKVDAATNAANKAAKTGSRGDQIAAINALLK